jgi:hypothetical protein
MPSPVALMPPINGGASLPDYAAMLCAELGADAGAPKCAEVTAVLNAHGRATKAADTSAMECAEPPLGGAP